MGTLPPTNVVPVKNIWKISFLLEEFPVRCHVGGREGVEGRVTFSWVALKGNQWENSHFGPISRHTHVGSFFGMPAFGCWHELAKVSELPVPQLTLVHGIL